MLEFSKKMIVGLLFLFATTAAFADVELFASNNTQEINIQSAYVRLTGQPQRDLKYAMLDILKKYHVEEGRSGSILGAYQMSTDKDMTADNTEYVYIKSSPKIVDIAKALAITLHQDSVAVFIPNKSTVGEISVNFTHPLNINNAIVQIRTELPALYSHGFSLHLSNTHNGFDHATVSEVEWLGSKVNINEIKRAFPNEKISARDGEAYLIYEDGKKEKL